MIDPFSSTISMTLFSIFLSASTGVIKGPRLYGESKKEDMPMGIRHSTMGQKRKKHRMNSHPIIHFPTSEGVSEMSEQANE